MTTTDRDLSWLDIPILTPKARRTNSKLRWFLDLLPVRAQAVIRKAARGELSAAWPVAPVLTLREFIALPEHRLLMQRNYGRRTQAAVCRIFRDHGAFE